MRNRCIPANDKKPKNNIVKLVSAVVMSERKKEKKEVETLNCTQLNFLLF